MAPSSPNNAKNLDVKVPSPSPPSSSPSPSLLDDNDISMTKKNKLNPTTGAAEASPQPKRPCKREEGLGYVMPLRFFKPPNAESFSPMARASVKVEPPPLAVPHENVTNIINCNCNQVVVAAPPPPPQVADRGCKQFWKAGDYEGPSHEIDSASCSVGMDHVRVHPKFLHSNATSHKWALGAFAELLDNSLDEVCNGATYVNVDMLINKKDGNKMLLVEDNGGGMTPDKMRQCMSLGYSAKSKMANTIGQYGNGFKTSTMRLGADVIVFSRCLGNNGRPTQSIGLLSYTFLRGTGKEDIVVPIIDFESRDGSWKKLVRTSEYDWDRNLETIVHWSPYLSEEELCQQFRSMMDHGTRVIIYNLWEDDEGQLELDFDADPEDIQIGGVNRNEKKINMAKQYPNSRHFLTYRHSLRSYASILYLSLPPQFKIFLRGKGVEHHNIVNDMMLSKDVTYRPQIPEGMPRDSNTQMVATVTVGFVKDAHYHIDVQGFNVYHKNRLIKPFWRVWNAAGSDGRGVIGVLEANFVEPAHDKQGFERTTVLSRLEQRLITMQKDYWRSNCQKVGYAARSRAFDSPNTKSLASDKERTMQTNQNGHVSTIVGLKTKSDEIFGKRSSPVNARTVNDRPQEVSHSGMEPQQGTASEERPHEMTRSSQVQIVAPTSTEARQHVVDSSVKNPIKVKEEKFDSSDRSVENAEPAMLGLLNDLNCEKERRKSLEIKLREAEVKVEKLDRELLVLIEMLDDERTKRQKEEERLMKSLTEANKTIEDLKEKVKVLESRTSGGSCK
ncbi:Histidine kinase-like ATPase, C-terminal domain containing protein [Trema orientale]|uniref:Histidine kinase-like ATPase, C-terminal domain containing protein n=1 Tax=Trema orientale TaxID=63057 RepID=A0A2P5F220_TREOI|nr:Histidine kinase-like ATPase, C-terminal domain containing protein [Trema orientale]